MTTENIDSKITLMSITRNRYGDELNIRDWNCEFKKWELQLILDGQYYKFLNKVKRDYRVDQKPIYRENPIMWKVILRKKPNANYFVSSLNIINHNITGSNIAEIDSTSEESVKDKGHFIADSFDKFLLTEDELKENKYEVQQFFGLGNKSNVSPQDSRANRNSKEYTGQLRFEQQVKNYLEKSTNANEEVYYEIEEFKIEEKILGRRIFIHWNQSDEADIHIFIPEDRD